MAHSFEYSHALGGYIVRDSEGYLGKGATKEAAYNDMVATRNMAEPVQKPNLNYEYNLLSGLYSVTDEDGKKGVGSTRLEAYTDLKDRLEAAKELPEGSEFVKFLVLGDNKGFVCVAEDGKTVRGPTKQDAYDNLLASRSTDGSVHFTPLPTEALTPSRYEGCLVSATSVNELAAQIHALSGEGFRIVSILDHTAQSGMFHIAGQKEVL